MWGIEVQEEGNISKCIADSSFPGDTIGKEFACQCRDIRNTGLIPGSGRPPGGGHGNPLKYSCLENPTDRGAWQTIVHRVAQSQTQLKQPGSHTWSRKMRIFLKPSFLGGCINLDYIWLHAMGLPSSRQQESKRRQSNAVVAARINVQGLKLLPPPCSSSSSQSQAIVQPTCSRQKEGEGQRHKVNCWPHWSE